MRNSLDSVAAAMADAFYRETESRKVKWDHMAPSDRSLWRLMARIAAEKLADQPTYRIAAE
jgi:hypothetical protein